MPRLLPHLLLTTAFLAALLPLAGCSEPPAAPVADLAGDWRAVLDSPGGSLPFLLRVRRSGEEYRAAAINGSEEAPFSSVRRDGETVTLAIDWYDSRIEARLSDDGQRLEGRWTKRVPEGVATLPFHATKGETRRFRAPERSATPPPFPSVTGTWGVVFTDAEGSQKAVGEFEQDGPRVTGTVLTPTGDYRFLEGEYVDGVLSLSTFDGAHAFLFRASARQDGSLAGDFWSRDSYHATWTAERLPEAGDGQSHLPDPFGLVRLTSQEQHFDFKLPDLDGETVSLADERFQGKVVILNVFGSWCPNCHDEAPLLADWYRRYHGRGLEIVGLAFEVTGDDERDREFVRRYAERHGIEYPLLLAGSSDKAAAANVLEELDRIVAYPTTVFIGRDGRVREIHSGFAGPGTGEHHERLVAELTELVERLLAEPTPTGMAPAG